MAQNYLILEDGTVLKGEAFGYDKPLIGELVFSTAMDGYQEELTDPSFCGQILMCTYPLIGNYGIMDSANESDKIHVSGLVVREYCKEPSPMYGGKPLDAFMKEHKIPGISGIDTRELVLKIRAEGTLKGIITSEENRIKEIISELKSAPSPLERNMLSDVSCKAPYEINNNKELTVGVLDCGTKKAILDQLSSRFNVKVFPYNTPAQEIIDSSVDGIMVTNGPGDPSQPEIMNSIVKNVKELSSKLPMMGICFGSQIIALALGAKTYKMKFGHRGSNQPVRYNGKVYVTAQNHGFAVDKDSLDGTGLIANQINVNDGSVEGVMHENLPIFTCQYHPEACGGPHDTTFFFDEFGKMMEVKK